MRPSDYKSTLDWPAIGSSKNEHGLPTARVGSHLPVHVLSPAHTSLWNVVFLFLPYELPQVFLLSLILNGNF